jgi:hypothetical protein
MALRIGTGEGLRGAGQVPHRRGANHAGPRPPVHGVPAISTGISGHPLDAATRMAVAAVRQATAEPSSLEHMVFACFDEDALAAYYDEGVQIAG